MMLPRRISLLIVGLLTGWATLPARSAEIVARADAGGGLTVEIEERRGRTFNANYGFVKNSNFVPRVLFQGRPVLLTGSTTQGTASEAWDAWVIRSPAGPAVLAAHREVFLITVREGQAQVQRIAGSRADASTLQALDGQHGQPERRIEVYQRNDGSAVRELRGDRLYLINDSTVLDTRSLRAATWQSGSDAKRKLAGDFAPERGRALMLSPKKARVAYFSRGPQNAVALVALDLATGEATQHVVIDRDLTYLGELDYYADAAWANRYFEWLSDGKGERVSLRRNAASIHKLGWHLVSGGALDHRYRLLAVETKMFDTLVTFIAAQPGARVDGTPTRDDLGRSASVVIGSRVLSIRWSRFENPPNYGHLELRASPQQPHAPQAGEDNFPALIARLATAFNAELAAGRHQALFLRE